MEILPFQKKDIPAAAALFIEGLIKLRQRLPVLPDRMENAAIVSGLLERLLTRSAGVAAYEGDRLLGYLGWWLVDGFRSPTRRAGYVPEWANATVEESKPAVIRALYRCAADIWTKAGCDTHAITLLASDSRAIETWFWNGFGLTVVDAVRTTRPLNAGAETAAAIPPGFSLRKAAPDDADKLAELESEHTHHYERSPVFMVPFSPYDAGGFRQYLAEPDQHAWLAVKGEEPAGYIRFEAKTFGAAEIVSGPGSTAITAAYVRPTYRGQGLSSALLEASQAYFSSQGIGCCSVDFESFNPEAAVFWMRYFEPACFSMVRVPEKISV